MSRPKGSKARCGFRCGHPRIGENILLKHGGYEACRMCKLAANTRQKVQRVLADRTPSLRPASVGPSAPVLRFRHCEHPRVPSNIYRNGVYDACKTCKKLWAIEYNATRREAPSKVVKWERKVLPETSAMQLYREEKARHEARRLAEQHAVIDDAKRQYVEVIKQMDPRKQGRPKGSKTNAWHHAAEVEL